LLAKVVGGGVVEKGRKYLLCAHATKPLKKITISLLRCFHANVAGK
jgi:hypothetical protein